MCLKFSNGGQMLACAYPRSKTSHYNITIYNSYTLEALSTLKNHTQIVTDIVFGLRDEFLVSCGLDGQMYRFSTETWERKDFAYQINQNVSPLLGKFNSLVHVPLSLQDSIIATTAAGDEHNQQHNHVSSSMVVEIKEEQGKDEQYIKHEFKNFRLTTL